MYPLPPRFTQPAIPRTHAHAVLTLFARRSYLALRSSTLGGACPRHYRARSHAGVRHRRVSHSSSRTFYNTSFLAEGCGWHTSAEEIACCVPQCKPFFLDSRAYADLPARPPLQHQLPLSLPPADTTTQKRNVTPPHRAESPRGHHRGSPKHRPNLNLVALSPPRLSSHAAMGTCGSRLQKQQRELTATATRSPSRRGRGGTRSRWKERSKQDITSTPPVCRRCTDAASTTAATPTSSSPKPFSAPQYGLPVPHHVLRSSVFPFLGSACLARAGSACRSWGEASVDESLWKALCLKRWVGKHVGEAGCVM